MPEGLEDEPVVDQVAERPAETLEQQRMEPTRAVCLDQMHEERSQLATLVVPISELVRIRRVEGDPEEDEARIGIFARPLRSREPSQGAMQSNPLGVWISLNGGLVLRTQAGDRAGCHRRHRLAPTLRPPHQHKPLLSEGQQGVALPQETPRERPLAAITESLPATKPAHQGDSLYRAACATQ